MPWEIKRREADLAPWSKQDDGGTDTQTLAEKETARYLELTIKCSH